LSKIIISKFKLAYRHPFRIPPPNASSLQWRSSHIWQWYTCLWFCKSIPKSAFLKTGGILPLVVFLLGGANKAFIGWVQTKTTLAIPNLLCEETTNNHFRSTTKRNPSKTVMNPKYCKYICIWCQLSSSSCLLFAYWTNLMSLFKELATIHFHKS